MSSASAGRSVSLSGGCVLTFFEPGGQRITRNPKDPGNPPHAGAFPIGGQNAFFFRFGVTVFRIKHARFAAVFAPILLVAITIFAILDQICTFAPWTGIGDFIDNHAPSIAESFTRSHYRKFKEADGKYNFPDGEIFTGPVEDSTNGWVRFSYPAIHEGQEIEDVQLEFESGKVVAEKAEKGEQLLTTLLNTDPGARVLGEWGIGTNYGIQRFTKNMLFDEKIGGTIHLALGSGYPETGSENESAIHWDMLCDMSQSEIKIDGEPFYRDGKFIV